MTKRIIRRRYYKKKGRWSANIKNINTSLQIASTGDFIVSQQLCKNPVQSDTTVSQQYTVKNVEFTFQLEMKTTSSNFWNIEALTMYIVYVPQGMTIDTNYIIHHPEYIMAYRFLGSPDVENDGVSDKESTRVYRNPIRVKSRLSRRLQTGDSIQFIITGITEDNILGDFLFVNGVVRWWTKAN